MSAMFKRDEAASIIGETTKQVVDGIFGQED
jgi:hypothetical protein